jgi:hypothetical protein
MESVGAVTVMFGIVITSAGAVTLTKLLKGGAAVAATGSRGVTPPGCSTAASAVVGPLATAMVRNAKISGASVGRIGIAPYYSCAVPATFRMH